MCYPLKGLVLEETGNEVREFVRRVGIFRGFVLLSCPFLSYDLIEKATQEIV
jgi:hypothetical protein